MRVLAHTHAHTPTRVRTQHSRAHTRVRATRPQPRPAKPSFRHDQRSRSRPQRLRAAASLRLARPQGAAESGALNTSFPARSPAFVTTASRRPATLQHCTLLARRPPSAHDGTDGGDPSPGVPTSLRQVPVSDLGSAACGEADLTNRSADSQLVTADTRRLQPPCQLSERRRGGRPHTILRSPFCLPYLQCRQGRTRMWGAWITGNVFAACSGSGCGVFSVSVSD